MTTPGVDEMLAGAVVDRRTALRAAAASALGLCLPGALAACGKTTVRAKRLDYAIEYSSGGGYPDTPPPGDLVRLLAARARQRHVAPFLGAPADPLSVLRQFVAPAIQVDPESGKHPPAYSVVVVGLADAGVASIAADAMKRGVKVVSYLADVKPRRASISVDAARLGSLLAMHVAGWAHERLGGRGDILLVPSAPAFHDPFALAATSRTEPALRATLAHSAPGMRIVATLKPGTEIVDALRAHPHARVVLCLSDDPPIMDSATRTTGLVAAARALRAAHPGTPGRLYVGGLGRPALSSRATITELRRDGVLRAVVAARPSDLANALVDVPYGLLRGETVRNVAIRLDVLTPGGAALAAHARDYSSDPAASLKTGNGSGINLNPSIDLTRTPTAR